MHGQSPRRHGQAKSLLDSRALQYRILIVRREYRSAAAFLRLGFVKSNIGLVDEFVSIHCRRRIDRKAATAAELNQCAAVNRDGRNEDLLHIFCERQDIFFAGYAFNYNRELVTAHAGGLPTASDEGAQPGGRFNQDAVAYTVAMHVVYRLEAIKIDDADGEGLLP